MQKKATVLNDSFPTASAVVSKDPTSKYNEIKQLTAYGNTEHKTDRDLLAGILPFTLNQQEC